MVQLLHTLINKHLLYSIYHCVFLLKYDADFDVARKWLHTVRTKLSLGSLGNNFEMSSSIKGLFVRLSGLS